MFARLFVAAILLSGADAFSPTARGFKQVVVGARSPTINMRGWDDPYAQGAGFKTEKLAAKKSSFDDEMDAINNKNNQVLGIALVAMIAVVAVLVGTTSMQAGVL